MFDTGDAIDVVRCRICGKDLRLISGRHLSIHGIDRETYMEEYGLSPDRLCPKALGYTVAAVIITRTGSMTGLLR